MKPEIKIGLLTVLTLFFIVGFGYILGEFSLFRQTIRLHLMYNFAGGIEKGSEVRLMGVKVGRVGKIQFAPGGWKTGDDTARLRITIDIRRDAAAVIHKDSRFFINMAGVIGEKYIEITPGSMDSDRITDGMTLRGVDPPRVDQLFSQSFGLAGRLIEFFDANRTKAEHIIALTESLLSHVNRAFAVLEETNRHGELAQLIANVTQITGDLAHVTGRLRTPEASKTIDLLYRLLWRLDKLDEPAIRKFFQQEGIKARVF